MSVLARVIKEREEWSALQRAKNRQNGIMAIDSGVMLLIGLLIIVYHHEIMIAVRTWLNL